MFIPTHSYLSYKSLVTDLKIEEKTPTKKCPQYLAELPDKYQVELNPHLSKPSWKQLNFHPILKVGLDTTITQDINKIKNCSTSYNLLAKSFINHVIYFLHFSYKILDAPSENIMFLSIFLPSFSSVVLWVKLKY